MLKIKIKLLALIFEQNINFSFQELKKNLIKEGLKQQ
jgi:hypothetical protein